LLSVDLLDPSGSGGPACGSSEFSSTYRSYPQQWASIEALGEEKVDANQVSVALFGWTQMNIFQEYPPIIKIKLN
uniref:Uncharacterized protein n=1 Tax=Haemonchus placei TaxID=6290 RepID=A0A0N4VWY2_HAEPC